MVKRLFLMVLCSFFVLSFLASCSAISNIVQGNDIATLEAREFLYPVCQYIHRNM